MRLVVDKSRKKHIPSSRNCERIDFNNYIQGGYLLNSDFEYMKLLNDEE